MHALDRMINLAGEIAEELLRLKDEQNPSITDKLKADICSLAELALSADVEPPSILDPEIIGISKVEQEGACADEPPTEKTDSPYFNEPPSPSEEPLSLELSPVEETTPFHQPPLQPESDNESIPIAQSQPQHESTPNPEPAPILQVAPKLESQAEPEIRPQSQPEAEPAKETKPAPEQPDSRPASETVQAPLPTLTASQLRRAFSINDIFLFRRELFGGSEARFAAALEGVALCPDFQQVRNYLTSTLGLNPKRRETREFVETLSQFF